MLLSVEIDQAGIPTNIKVGRGLGLGLNEKAIEAVKQWTFKPAKATEPLLCANHGRGHFSALMLRCGRKTRSSSINGIRPHPKFGKWTRTPLGPLAVLPSE